jgi:hypothetical protein
MESMAVSLAANVAAKKMSRGSASSAYAREWKRVFHRDLPSKSAAAAIDFSLVAAPKGLRRRTMKGGQAPVDWTTVPHQTAPALPGQVTASGYIAPPNILPYVSGSFGVGVPEPSIGCKIDSVNPFPAPYADLGINAVSPHNSGGANAVSASLRGGRRKSLRRQRGGDAFLAAAYRPILSQNPTSFMQDMQTSWNGQAPAASPSATDPAFTYRFNGASASELGLTAYTRMMSNDMSSVPPRAQTT